MIEAVLPRLPLFRLSEHSVKCLFIPIYHISQGQLIQAAQLI